MGKLFLIGSMVVLCACASGKSLSRKRRQDFVFPDDVLSFYNHGQFPNQFPDVFSNPFQEQPQNPPRQQFFQQQQPTSDGFFLQQGREFYPRPFEFGFGSPSLQQPTTVRPEQIITTASPGLLACMENCPTTSEYNPICGTNRQLYGNEQKFNCAVRCGAQVGIWRRGSCEGLFNMMRG